MNSPSALLATALVEAGWASEDQIVGCSESEIQALEQSLHLELPPSYREFLRRMGKGAGKFEAESTWTLPFLQDARKTADEMVTSVSDEEETAFELPPSAFVFLESNASQILYFNLEEGDDPPVYLYEAPRAGAEKVSDSFSEWLELYSRDIKASQVHSESLGKELEKRNIAPGTISIEAPKQEAHEEGKYSKDDIVTLLKRVLAVHCTSPTRAWKPEAVPGLNNDLYERALGTIERISEDPTTSSATYKAPTAYEALLFLVDTQRRQAIFNPLQPQAEVHKGRSYKSVFRTYSDNKLTDAIASLGSPNDSARHELALMVYCFLMKEIAERNIEVSFQAHLYQSVADSVGIPTDLLKWTSDPFHAVLSAQAMTSTGEATICFTNYQSQRDLRILLPSPLQPDAVIKGRIYHNTHSFPGNQDIYQSAHRISFPVDKSFALSHPVDGVVPWPPAIQKLITKFEGLAKAVVPVAYHAVDSVSQKFLDGLINPTLASIEAYQHHFAETIASLAAQFAISRQEWEIALQVWAASIELYVIQLFAFQDSSGAFYIAKDQVFDLIPRNRDALKLYTEVNLSRIEDPKTRAFLLELQKRLDEYYSTSAPGELLLYQPVHEPVYEPAAVRFDREEELVSYARAV